MFCLKLGEILVLLSACCWLINPTSVLRSMLNEFLSGVWEKAAVVVFAFYGLICFAVLLPNDKTVQVALSDG